jgi:hypothetical protein
VNQFAGAREWQHLTLSDRHAQGMHIRAVWHSVGQTRRKGVGVELPTAAWYGYGSVLNHIEGDGRHVDERAAAPTNAPVA